MSLDWNTLAILAGVACIAGFFDAIAGGGGLITLPALMIAGVEPISAIATNKVPSSAASISATATFAHKGLVEWRTGRFMILSALLGGATGALLVNVINQYWLTACIPVLLICVAFYFAFVPQVMSDTKHRKISITFLSLFIIPLLGLYDGMFGPGVGSFLMVTFVLFGRLTILRAMSFTKLANASSNLGSLMIFTLTGKIIWPIALTMALASSIGAQLGARCAIRTGASLIRPMIVIVCCALVIKLLSAPDNPLRIMLLQLSNELIRLFC